MELYTPLVKIKKDNTPILFLAGSIQTGDDNWRTIVINELTNYNVKIINPQTENYENNIKQQTLWELDAMETASIIAMYFASNNYSPISLFEFGLFVKTKKLIVCCENDFWKKDYINIICEKYGIKNYKNIQKFISNIKIMLKVK